MTSAQVDALGKILPRRTFAHLVRVSSRDGRAHEHASGSSLDLRMQCDARHDRAG